LSESRTAAFGLRQAPSYITALDMIRRNGSMSIQRIRIRGRLYSGFGALVLFSLMVALFGIWQLSGIQSQVGKMNGLSTNSNRALQISAQLQGIRHAILHYSVDADDASFKDSADREAKTIDLLQAAAKVTLSQERIKIYNDLQANIGQLGAKREVLGDAVKKMTGARTILSSVGDELAADVTKLVEVSRSADTASTSLRAGMSDLNADILLVRVANWQFLATRDPAGIATFKTNLDKARQQIESLEKMDLPESMRPLEQSTKTALDKYATAFETTSTNLLKGDDIYNNDILKLDVDSLRKISTAEASLTQDFDTTTKETDDTISGTIALQAAITGLIVLLGGLFAFLIARGISRPIQGMTQAMTTLAAGNLQVEVPALDKKDEIGEMAKAVLVFRDAAVENARLEREAAEHRAQAEHERARNEQAQREAIEQERAIVADSIGVGLNKLAAKDLTYRMSSDIPEAYRKLQSDFNAAIAQLETALRCVTDSTSAIHAGTEEISTAADDLSRRTEQQAASLEQTAAALEEITTTVKKSAEGATHARQVVAAADEDAKKSALVVRQAVEAMDAIAKSAQQISQIIGVIDEIAFQTNLLALNAGVEAARAGDAGRGFAVVASEVRALAQRSAEAAKEIKGLITASTRQVENGVKLVGETGASLERIMGQVTEINAVVGEIAVGAREQATGIGEVNTAITQMDQMTQQNSAMVEESTAATHSLSQETTQLSGLIGQFQLGRTDDNDSMRRELQKVAPHAFRQPPKAAAPKGAPAETRKAAARPVHTMPKAKVANGAPVDVAEGGWKEF
jgi:methyl-accepting chemotaxis protein